MVAMKTTQYYIPAGSIMKGCYLKKVWNENGKENCLNFGFKDMCCDCRSAKER
jgi:hypothetical protein